MQYFLQLSIIAFCVYNCNHSQVSSTTSCSNMWSNLPSDLLSNIFSYLPPHSIPRATAVCRHWRDSARSIRRHHHHYPPWFIALPTRTTTNKNHFCFIHNPIENTWHSLNSKHVSNLIKPMSTIGGHGLILFKAIGGVPIQLSVGNPFTGQFGQLPPLQKPRRNPAVGIIEVCPGRFEVYVAGGMSEAASGGAASYEPTLEMFDSGSKRWTVVGSMPVEFAVRLTVWTPNESVYSNGFLYWMTSARAYSIMGFEIGTNKWTEFSVPMGYMLEFAALVPRHGKLAVIGGVDDGDVVVWEKGEGGEWNVIERLPVELRKRFVRGNTKCVGIEGGVCLYRDMASGMVMWRRGQNHKDGWEWSWIEGCNQISGRHIENYPIKGLFLHPNLASSSFI